MVRTPVLAQVTKVLTLVGSPEERGLKAGNEGTFPMEVLSIQADHR